MGNHIRSRSRVKKWFPAHMDIAHNPNGSLGAIEGITSPCGRILGKMGHTERSGTHIAKNHPRQQTADDHPSWRCLLRLIVSSGSRDPPRGSWKPAGDRLPVFPQEG
jgi:hypothetical protein